MKNKKDSKKKVQEKIHVRAEFGARNLVSFELPLTKALAKGNLAALKAAIREHCPKAVAAEVQYPDDAAPEILTLSRRPSELIKVEVAK